MIWGSLVLAAFAMSVAVVLPRPALAVGSAADAICAASQCNQPKRPPCAAVVCTDTTNGFPTKGVCVSSTPGICGGQSSGGQNGGMEGMQQALQAIQQILQAMKGGGGGGGGGGDQSGLTNNPALGGCAQYYNVTTPSSDPCAVYVPPISDSLGSTTSSASNDLISSLLSGTYANPFPTTNTQSNTNTSATATTQGQTTVPAQTNPASPFLGTILPISGLSGDIQYSTQDVTVLVNNVDTKGNTQVAGFYGTGASGQPQTVIGGMCAARPWSNNFLSFIIPPAFFDSLCTLRGYKVGAPVSAPAPSRSSSAKPKPTGTIVPAATSSGPYVTPQADIWAVPAAVALGARTTVFWNAKGVTSCNETSPDGSFTQSTLSGGAATVPLSGATTYTISCITPSGDHITNYVTVNLSAN